MPCLNGGIPIGTGRLEISVGLVRVGVLGSTTVTVDGNAVHLTPRTDRPEDVDFEMMEKITAAAFGQRRKMLRSSLRSLGGEKLLEEAGINPELRAENLTVRDFEKLVLLLGS